MRDHLGSRELDAIGAENHPNRKLRIASVVNRAHKARTIRHLGDQFPLQGREKDGNYRVVGRAGDGRLVVSGKSGQFYLTGGE